MISQSLHSIIRSALLPVVRMNARQLIAKYLAEECFGTKKLHCGCGLNFLDGWLNTDIHGTGLFCKPRVFLDVTRPLPFPNASLDFIFSEHMIEHIPLEKTRFFLAEAQRVLKPGGVIRTAFPCLEFLIELNHTAGAGHLAFLESLDVDVIRAGFASPALAINAYYREWGHQVIYDFTLFSDLLERAGFIAIKKENLGRSTHPELTGIEVRGRGTRVYDVETPYVVEAQKIDENPDRKGN